LPKGPGKDGVTVKFDDLPLPYRGNVDVQAPFDPHTGDQPALTEDDIKDIVTFLNTLTDGYESQATTFPHPRSARHHRAKRFFAKAQIIDIHENAFGRMAGFSEIFGS
jgi:hypothetical protein